MGKWYSDRCQHNSVQREKAKKYLALASGAKTDSEYTYVLNPTADKKKTNYPAKLHNFPIILPIMRQLQGEKAGRNFEPLVLAVNSDVDNTRQNFLRDGILQTTHQTFVNALIKQGMFVEGQMDEQGQPIQEPQHPDEIRKQAQNLPDTMSIMGQRAIEYIKQDQNVVSNLRRCWHHFLSTTHCVTFRGVQHDNVKHYACNPIFFDYFANSTEKFVDKMEAQRYITDFTYSDLVDVFGEMDDAKEMLKKLKDDTTGNSKPGRSFFQTYVQNQTGQLPVISPPEATGVTFSVEHIQWTGLIKLKVLNLDGEVVYLDEDYKPLPGEECRTIWVNQKFEVYRVADEYTIGGQVLEDQRGDMDNPSDCRSNYGGYVFNLGDGMLQQGIVEQLAAYQHAYNATKWKLQSLINKYKGKKTIIFKSMLVDDADSQWRWDKVFDLADAIDFLVLDDSNPQITALVQGIKDINPGDAQQIQLVMNHCEQIKIEAEELVGFNRFRKGNTQASDGVGNAQQGEYVGSLITELYFQEFADFERSEYEALLYYSKRAWKKGKKATYMRSDAEIALLDVNPDNIGTYSDANFACFVVGTGEAKRNLEILKQQAQAFVQNGLGASSLAKILKPGKTFASIQESLEEDERRLQAQEQAKQDQEASIAQQQMEQLERQHAEDMKFKYYQVDAPLQVKIQEILAKASEGGEQGFAYEELILKLNQAVAEAHAKQRALEVELYKVDVKAGIDKYKADKQLQVARTNPG